MSNQDIVARDIVHVGQRPPGTIVLRTAAGSRNNPTQTARSPTPTSTQRLAMLNQRKNDRPRRQGSNNVA